VFVITADQVGSRHSADLVGATVARLDEVHQGDLSLPVDRNAGDELQALVATAKTALSIVLDLTRSRDWSVGLGVGGVELPLPKSTREARGPAFLAARSAVSRAKKAPLRFALEADNGARSVEPLIAILLALRDRRTEQGWQVYDHIAAGHSQKSAARELGITPQAVSERMSVAQVRIDLEAHEPLIRLLATLDQAVTATEETTT
jgi:DNA-binding NarL/FixJ family response regulator